MNDEKIIAALLAYPTIRAAAEALNISEGTIYNRMNDIGFADKLNREKVLILEQCATAFQADMDKARSTLVSIMENEENPTRDRIQAACSVLKYGETMLTVAKNQKRAELANRTELDGFDDIFSITRSVEFAE